MIICTGTAPYTTVFNLFMSTRIYVKIALTSHWNDCCLIPLEKCASWRRATNRCKNFKFLNLWEHPLYKIWEYAFNIIHFPSSRQRHQCTQKTYCKRTLSACVGMYASLLQLRYRVQARKGGTQLSFWYECAAWRVENKGLKNGLPHIWGFTELILGDFLSNLILLELKFDQFLD